VQVGEVAVSEACVHRAGGGYQAVACCDWLAVDGLANAQLGLRGFQGLSEGDGCLQIFNALAEAASAIDGSRSQCGDGVRGAFEPDSIWIIGCGVEAG